MIQVQMKIITKHSLSSNLQMNHWTRGIMRWSLGGCLCQLWTDFTRTKKLSTRHLLFGFLCPASVLMLPLLFFQWFVVFKHLVNVDNYEPISPGRTIRCCQSRTDFTKACFCFHSCLCCLMLILYIDVSSIYWR